VYDKMMYQYAHVLLMSNSLIKDAVF